MIRTRVFARAVAGAAVLASSAAVQAATDSGWSFEPHGRIQFDAGHISVPDRLAIDESADHEIRRARLQGEGTAPGGIGFRVELDFAPETVEVTDAYLTYSTGQVKITAGQHNGFQSLEELTSSRFTSFMERAAFTDAFGFERRLGISAQYSHEAFLLQGGVFADNLHDLPSKSKSADLRAVAMPKMGSTQVHLGASAHYMWDDNGDSVRFRSRPLLHFADLLLTDTGRIPAEKRFGAGIEAAAARGPLHAAAEAYWQHVDAAAGADDANFFGAYAEVGIFLTKDDTRPYSKGVFGRVKPVRPVGKGGAGAMQINLRYDYLDLADGPVAGGRQSACEISFVWTPTQYTRLLAEYGHLHREDAGPAVDGDYNADIIAMRAQFDF